MKERNKGLVHIVYRRVAQIALIFLRMYMYGPGEGFEEGKTN